MLPMKFLVTFFALLCLVIALPLTPDIDYSRVTAHHQLKEN
jgi:hypothetical protein